MSTTEPDPESKHKLLVAQFLKFGVVGGVSFVVDAGLLMLMYAVLRWNGELASLSLGRWLVQHHLALFPPTTETGDALIKVTRNASLIVFQPISAGIAIVTSFYLNRRWTFGITLPEGRQTQFRRFVSLYIGSLVLGSLVLVWLSTFMPVFPAKIVVTALTALANFTGQRLWTFKKP